MTVSNEQFEAFLPAIRRGELDPRTAEFEIQLGLGKLPPLDILNIRSFGLLHPQVLSATLSNVSVRQHNVDRVYDSVAFLCEEREWSLFADDVSWPTRSKITANYAVVFVKETGLPVSRIDFGIIVEAIGAPQSLIVKPPWYKFWQKPYMPIPTDPATLDLTWPKEGIISWPVASWELA